MPIPSLFRSQNVVAFIVSTAIMVVWVELVKLFAKNGLMQTWHRRKVLHILTGPIFIITWHLFTNDEEGSQYAAAVPGVMTLKFFLVGIGALDDQDTVNSAARNGNRSELLRGPLFYGIIFVLSTLWFWKQQRGVISLFVLCFGDGFAELFGRTFGHFRRLFWSPGKSVPGLLGFISMSTLCTWLFITCVASHYAILNNDSLTTMWGRQSDCSLAVRILFVSVVCGLVETLPVQEIDNITIFIAGIVADCYFCQHHKSIC